MEEIVDVEKLFDDPADFEEKEDPSEDIADRHFRRIQAIPILSEAEEADLLRRWCAFKDEKAREQLVESHLRMVPPIARSAAYKAGFEPHYEMMAGTSKWIAGIGLDEVISDLTAAGNLGLMQAVDGYRLGRNVKFYTYARQCVRREIWKQATFLRSVVERKDGSSAIMDLSIEPGMPDVRDFRDYCGSHANAVRPTAINDKSTDWGMTKAPHTRSLPQFEKPLEGSLNLSCLPESDQLLLTARMRGINLTRIAEALGVSVTTVWRREQRAIARIKTHGNPDCRSSARDT